MLRGFPSGKAHRVCSIHQLYSSSDSPFQAKTGTPVAAMAAAAWSWVEKMLHEDQETWAPRAVRVSMRTAVWMVLLISFRFDGDCSSDLHVETSSNSGTLQGLVGAVLLTDGHESGHLVLSELDLLSAEGGEGDVCDFVVGLYWGRSVQKRNVRGRTVGRRWYQSK